MDKKLKDIFVILVHLSRKKRKNCTKFMERQKCLIWLFRKVAQLVEHQASTLRFIGSNLPPCRISFSYPLYNNPAHCVLSIQLQPISKPFSWRTDLLAHLTHCRLLFTLSIDHKIFHFYSILN